MIKTDKPILVTGSAGFIGFHLSKRLLEDGYDVVGIDNLNDYYDVKLKEDRNSILKKFKGYTFHKLHLSDIDGLKDIFDDHRFEFVIHLAAQAGVRYSLENPFAYTDSNITSFVNVLERCKDHQVKHLVFASSSSVYGANTKMPFSVSDNVDHPISLYAATKKANELIAHSYASSFKLPVTGLRFFTVYGPWGRPDMALFLFTDAILNNRPIKVFNNGNMKRDFTYVEDIVKGVLKLIPHVPSSDENWRSEEPNPDSSFAPYRIFNIGHNSPVPLMNFVERIEIEVGKKAEIEFLPMQLGDVESTFADVGNLVREIGYSPETSIELGIKEFVNWYKDYYSI